MIHNEWETHILDVFSSLLLSLIFSSSRQTSQCMNDKSSVKIQHTKIWLKHHRGFFLETSSLKVATNSDPSRLASARGNSVPWYRPHATLHRRLRADKHVALLTRRATCLLLQSDPMPVVACHPKEDISGHEPDHELLPKSPTLLAHTASKDETQYTL